MTQVSAFAVTVAIPACAVPGMRRPKDVHISVAAMNETVRRMKQFPLALDVLTGRVTIRAISTGGRFPFAYDVVA